MVTCEYGLTVGWDAYADRAHQTYCTVHGRTTTTTIQQYPFNAGMVTTNDRPGGMGDFLKPTAEYGASHYEDVGTAVVFRVPYRTAFYRNAAHTVGPDLDRIARTVLFVRPNVVFVFDTFRQSEGQTSSYIRTNFHFTLEAGAPEVTNGGRDVTVTFAPNRLWGHMSHPVTPASNACGLFDGWKRDSYCWQATAGTDRNQFFLHTFRAADVAGYSAPTYADFTGTDVFGCLVSGLETSEGGQVCGVFVDSGTDDVPAGVAYSVAQSGACTHYVAGLKKNTSYTVSASLVAGTTSVTIAEGVGSITNVGGMLKFEVA